MKLIKLNKEWIGVDVEMLKFIGSGSAFNTKLGNNSAYYKNGSNLLLIDCGTTVFSKIKENNLLDGIDDITVLITHCHDDHLGSLASLILYTFYSHGEFAKSKVTVYAPFDTKVDELLKINGCVEGIHFNIKLLVNLEISSIENCKFKFNKTSHVNELEAYSLNLLIEDSMIFYSADSNGEYFKGSINPTIRLHYYDILYIDTCKADYPGNVHLSLRELCELVPVEYRHKVWCMHLDERFDRVEAEELGFNVVTNEI